MSEGAGSFEGEDGVEISYRTWPASGAVRAPVVISHGGGEHSGRYAHVARRLGAAGYPVWAIDHRGHGLSEGERMRFSSVAPMAADLRTMIGIAAVGGAVAASRSCWLTAWAPRSAWTTRATTRTSCRG